MVRGFLRQNPSVIGMLAVLALFLVLVTVLAEGSGLGLISTSFVKTLGKTLCLSLVAVAMDLIWGYTGILSLGHFAFFGLGGYMIGIWLMYERTAQIVTASLADAALPATAAEIRAAIANQIFGVVGSSDFPLVWAFADSLAVQLALVLLVPATLALLFGWLAFRSRVSGVYLSILTQAMTLALSLYLFQNASGLRGNNGLSGLQNLPGVTAPQSTVSLYFFWASGLALALGYVLAAWIVAGKFGAVIRGIRDNEARVRFLGYSVEGYKLFMFVLTACIAAVAGALYYPQAGIINPAEIAPIASIYLAVWVAIGGRGRLYGAVIGAAFVNLVSSWLTGGQVPDITIGSMVLKWVDWWLIVLGTSFVLVTLFAPRGIGGLIDLWTRARAPKRHGAALGPDMGALREKEASE